MKLTCQLDNETVEALVRAALSRRFPTMRITEVSIGYTSRGSFEMEDADEPVAAPTPVEPLTADNF